MLGCAVKNTNGIAANVKINLQDIVLNVVQICGAERTNIIAVTIVIPFVGHVNQNHVFLSHGNAYLKREVNRIGKNNSQPRTKENVPPLSRGWEFILILSNNRR